MALGGVPELAKPKTWVSSPEVKTSVSVGFGVAAFDVHSVQVVAVDGQYPMLAASVDAVRD